MKMLYIGTVVTDKTIEKLNKYCVSKKPTMAGILFDRNVVDGLSNYCDIEAISLIPVPSYPACKKISVNEKTEKYMNTKIEYVKFLNIPIIKYFIIMIKLMYLMMKWNKKNKKEKDKVLVVASIDIIFSLPSVIIKKIFNNKIVSCVTDLPEFTMKYRTDENKIKNRILKMKNKLYDKIKGKMDGYIFLSKYMNEKVNMENKPYVIIDGMISEKAIINKSVKKEENYTIMYAGGLNVSYGIKNLVNGFQKANIKNSQLWIFGSGDYEKEIERMAKKDKRIKFLGQVEHNKILEYEKRATILINPRPIDEEYVKYSFPSKTLEYMLSETVLLTTNLPTITEEYKEKLILIEDHTSDGIAEAILQCKQMSENELKDLGKRAKQFILENKTNTIQGNKIYQFIQENII